MSHIWTQVHVDIIRLSLVRNCSYWTYPGQCTQPLLPRSQQQRYKYSSQLLHTETNYQHKCQPTIQTMTTDLWHNGILLKIWDGVKMFQFPFWHPCVRPSWGSQHFPSIFKGWVVKYCWPSKVSSFFFLQICESSRSPIGNRSVRKVNCHKSMHKHNIQVLWMKHTHNVLEVSVSTVTIHSKVYSPKTLWRHMRTKPPQ